MKAAEKRACITLAHLERGLLSAYHIFYFIFIFTFFPKALVFLPSFGADSIAALLGSY